MNMWEDIVVVGVLVSLGWIYKDIVCGPYVVKTSTVGIDREIHGKEKGL
jgi:hypothetical protein